jgi:hypothetical protein
MQQQIETFAAAGSTLLSAIAGSKLGLMIANAMPMPEWMQWLLGPFGALIGVLLALVWMSKRLNAAEDREETRRKEREAERTNNQDILIALVKDSNQVTTTATEVMRDVRETLSGCPGHNKQH